MEIPTNKGDHGRFLTRTIGDPSTGTEPTLARSSSSPSSSPEPTTPPERPNGLTDENSDTTIKPTQLELPRPRDSAIEESISDTTTNSPAPHVLTPGSTSSTAGLSTSTGSSSIQYESGMRVLVVDDDLLTRKLISRMLTRLGCKVTTAENGEIALDLILNPVARPTPSSEDTGSSGLVPGEGSGAGDERYAVVFLDNQMPVLSGLEVVGKLRRRGRRDFVVGVTGKRCFFRARATPLTHALAGNALLTDQQEYLDAGVDQ